MTKGSVAPDYSTRVVDRDLDELLPALPAIALEGPKGVGKTATAQRRAKTVIRLDDPADAALLDADPVLLARSDPPVLLDEWQRMPTSWDLVRRAVDNGASPGSFLLTGSAMPADASVHSGAGRIDSIRMRPMSLAERLPGIATISLAVLLAGGRPDIGGDSELTVADYRREILTSGFPGIRRLEGRALRVRLDGYLRAIVQRDFPDQGLSVRRPETLLAWLRAYAAATSTTSSFATIAASASGAAGTIPAKTTTIAYRDILSQLWLLDPVEAWLPSGSALSRLTKAPKHQLADPALAARLLDLGDGDFVPGGRGAAMLGPLFEHLVALGVQTYAASAQARVGHLRTKAGEHEVDLIIEREGAVVAVEVKLARAIGDADVRHLRWLQEALGDRLVDAVVVTTGQRAYRRPDGIAVVPAALLGP